MFTFCITLGCRTSHCLFADFNTACGSKNILIRKKKNESPLTGELPNGKQLKYMFTILSPKGI